MIQAVAMSAAGGALVGSLLAAWAMGTYKDATWSAATNEIKVEAAALLQAATEEAMQVERAASSKVRELEASHVEKEKDLAVIQRRNRQLATQLGGLRDPGRRPRGPDAVPTTTTGANCPEDSTSAGHLSAEASNVLLDAAAEVDALAGYAKTCYDWKEVVMKAFEQKEE